MDSCDEYATCIDLRYVNFIYALVVGHACAKHDRFCNIETWDIWDDEDGVKFYAGMVISLIPANIANDWYETMAKRIAKRKTTITEYINENPGNIPPKRAANWITRNWHIINNRKLNEAKQAYLERCVASVTICVEHPDAEHQVSPRIKRAYDLINSDACEPDPEVEIDDDDADA